MAKPKKSVVSAMLDPVLPEETPFLCPSNWAWARLIQIFNFIDYRGKTPKKTESGIPLVTAKNIRKGYLDYSISEYISEEEYLERVDNFFAFTDRNNCQRILAEIKKAERDQ